MFALYAANHPADLLPTSRRLREQRRDLAIVAMEQT